MGRIKTIARRSFLIGSVAIVGGVAFGAYKVLKPHANPLLDDLASNETAFNPYVKISDKAVTLVVPHADKGQGVHSMQAALIAEELDIDLDQVRLTFGQPSPAYFNTAFSDEGVPFESFDDSTIAQTMRSAVWAITKLVGLMGTGGSTSTPDQFEKLRMAGAVARETLKQAASNRTGVALDQLQTANGAVHLPDGAEIAYTELATDAAQIDPVTDVTLRDPSQWRILGKPMMRVDIAAKSTGTQVYGIDLAVNGMVHATVRTNPRQGGVLNSFDATTAKSMRGVKDILPVTGGIAVIADNTWRAIQAANAVECDWGPADYPLEQDQHWAALSGGFIEENLDSEWRNDGDVETGLAKGTVINAEYRAPYVAHAPLEPLNAIVRVTDTGAEVWAGHQMQRFLQQKVAEIAGCDPEQVIFHNQFMGGSFGHRLEFENVKLATEIAVQMKGTPVKLTYSREEDFSHDFPRQIGMARSQGTVKDGGIDSWSLDIATPSVLKSQMTRAGIPIGGSDAQIVAGAWNMPFNVPNLRVRAYAVPGLAPTSSWRSVGASTAGFFAEGFFDELCTAAGADPLAERLRLVNKDVHRKVLETVGEMSNWGNDLGPDRGRGLAMVESFGVPVAQVIEVTNTPDGIKIDKVYVAADVGTMIDPVNFDNQVKGGVVWALGHAMNCEITYSDGMPDQDNYHSHEGMRMHQCPKIIVKGLENAPKIRGIGEPPVPPAAPALANAIFNATGQRIREMPFYNHVDFV